MVNPVLLVGVPMVALLAAAAYYVFRQGQQMEQNQSLDGDSSATKKSVFSGVNPRRRQHVESAELCQICFESTEIVQLYPCEHRDICRNCVLTLLRTNKRQCPFCRFRIDGFY